ncbi:MAG: NAD(P)/FAD-dependent oxidoreductase [Nitrospirota bacterium]
MSNKYDYDAIIIGAGISGLVCGCYLAKAGMKTLIVEKNAKPGGYCTSFTRGGFHFDACVHSLGSLREGGNIRIILKELGLEKRLKIKRYDPSDIIIAPDFKIHFWNNLEKTIQEFQDNFPKEAKKIKEFFTYINGCEGISFSPLRSITFQVLLDKYFKDDRLKAILSLPLLGNAGLPAKQISAITGTLIYKEFMFDGGYYPDNSIQAFADILIERFKEFGGDVYFSCLAKRIKIKNKKVESVEIGRKGLLSAKYVISNADATQTFLTLIGEELVNKDIVNKLKSLVPSLSMLILYLGIGKCFNSQGNICPNTNIWFLPYYDIDKMYKPAIEGEIDNLDWFLVRLSSDNKSILMIVNAPFKDKEYWKVNKKRLINVFIKKVERVFPNLSSHIVFKDAATPNTLYKWTLNYRGAAYGWAGIPSQFAVTGFTQRTNFENLYLTGHWTTLVQGVAGVAYLGRDTSKKILNKEINL